MSQIQPDIATKKTCLHCPKQLRPHNKSGLCTACHRAAKPNVNGKTINDYQRAYWAKKRGHLAADATALARFRVVAAALRPGGMGPDELIEQFAQAWLDGLTPGLAPSGPRLNITVDPPQPAVNTLTTNGREP